MRQKIKDRYVINFDKDLRDKLGLKIGDDLVFNIIEDNKLIVSKYFR